MKVEKAHEICEEITRSIGEIFVDKQEVIRKTLCASLANGHILFEDYPGAGKTLLAKLFSKTIGCDWKRIQFTPDLMPADITGTRIWQPNKAKFRFEKGPVFTNVLLADEINRATPKTQSALLEVMEEKQITIAGTTHDLETPFFVMATQNPLEIEGTYPLPETQIDRFMIKLSLGYVDTLESETEILRRRKEWKRDDPSDQVKKVTTKNTFRKIQEIIENSIFVHENVLDYIAKTVREVRKNSKIDLGPSPRGGLALFKLSRANALLEGRDFVIPNDVKQFVKDALAHRIILSSEPRINGEKAREIIQNLTEKIKTPRKYKPG